MTVWDVPISRVRRAYAAWTLIAVRWRGISRAWTVPKAVPDLKEPVVVRIVERLVYALGAAIRFVMVGKIARPVPATVGGVLVVVASPKMGWDATMGPVSIAFVLWMSTVAASRGIRRV